MSKIIITKGSSSCEDCGWYDWHRVECPDLGIKDYYDGHLSGGHSIEEMLIEVLTQLGHSVEVVGEED